MCRSPRLVRAALGGLCLWAAAVSAGRPELTLGIDTAKVGAGAALGGLEPHAQWSTGARVGDVDVDGGIDVTVEDVDDYPYRLWGRARRTLAGWDLAARVDAASRDLRTLALSLQAARGPTALQLQGVADTAARSGAVTKVSLVQRLFRDALTLSPTYDVTSQEAEVGVIYSGLPDTILSLDASTAGPQVLTISQKIGENDQLIPSISTTGDIEVEYRRAVRNGVVVATVKPNKSVTLNWREGPWLATIVSPMTGPVSFSKDVNISFKREVKLF